MDLARPIMPLVPAILIAYCFSAQATQSVPLYDAIANGDKQTVKRLIDEGADVNATDADGFRALHFAAMLANAEIAAMLINRGALVDATTTQGGTTPLHVASMLGNHEVVTLLLAKGADARVKASDGTTPLSRAATNGETRVVLALLPRYKDAGAVASTLTTCVQASLRNAGYGGGSIDGRVGPETTAAIKRFQHDAGLEPDGKASVRLIEEIVRRGTFDVVKGSFTFETNVFVRYNRLQQEQRWQPPLFTTQVQGVKQLAVRVAIVEDTHSGLVEKHSLVCSTEGGLLFKAATLTGEPAVQNIMLPDHTGRSLFGLFRLGNLEIKGCATLTRQGIFFRKRDTGHTAGSRVTRQTRPRCLTSACR